MKDWASWVANAKFKSDAQRVGAENAVARSRTPRAEPDAIELPQDADASCGMIVLKVMYENGIDVFVNPENTLPPYKIGGPGEPDGQRSRLGELLPARSPRCSAAPRSTCPPATRRSSTSRSTC